MRLQRRGSMLPNLSNWQAGCRRGPQRGCEQSEQVHLGWM